MLHEPECYEAILLDKIILRNGKNTIILSGIPKHEFFYCTISEYLYSEVVNF